MNESKLNDLLYSSEYAEYIMRNCNGERIICNGDMLLDAMEDEYLFEQFLSEYTGLTAEQ